VIYFMDDRKTLIAKADLSPMASDICQTDLFATGRTFGQYKIDLVAAFAAINF